MSSACDVAMEPSKPVFLLGRQLMMTVIATIDSVSVLLLVGSAHLSTTRMGRTFVGNLFWNLAPFV